MQKRRTVMCSISLYPEDLEIARKAAEYVGQRGISAGLRAIIAEYRRLKKQAESHSSIIQGG